MDLTPRSCRSDSAASIASSEVLENLLELLELDFDEFCMLQEIKNEFSYTYVLLLSCTI